MSMSVDQQEINYEDNYVMYLRTVQSSNSCIIEALKEILTDTNLIDGENIKVIAMDPSIQY